MSNRSVYQKIINDLIDLTWEEGRYDYVFENLAGLSLRVHHRLLVFDALSKAIPNNNVLKLRRELAMESREQNWQYITHSFLNKIRIYRKPEPFTPTQLSKAITNQ